MELDPVLDAFIGGLQMPDITTEVPDAIDELRENGALAAQLGGDQLGHAHVDRFRDQTAQLDARAERIFKRDRTTPAPPSNDWDAPLTDDSHALAKMESAFDRRKQNYAVWMRTELALGKSARELIDHAAQHDAGVANILREVAKDLGEAT